MFTRHVRLMFTTHVRVMFTTDVHLVFTTLVDQGEVTLGRVWRWVRVETMGQPAGLG
jgi:hypothetical protein